MFRKGGGVNMNGIMSGIEDRENFQSGTGERLIKAVGERGGIDPLSQFLIQGGLRLASQPSTGGVISDIATAAQEPTADLFARLAAIEDEKRKLKLAGEEIDIASETSQREFERESKMRKDLLEQELNMREKLALMDSGASRDKKIDYFTEKYFSIYNDAILAENRAMHDVDNVPYLIKNKFGRDQYGGLLEGGDIYAQAQKLGKKNNEGKVYFDLADGQSKRLRRDTTGKYTWEPVSLEGQPEEGVGQPGPEDTATADAEKIATADKKKFEDVFKPGATPTDKAILETIRSTSRKLKEGQKKITGPFR